MFLVRLIKAINRRPVRKYTSHQCDANSVRKTKMSEEGDFTCNPAKASRPSQFRPPSICLVLLPLWGFDCSDLRVINLMARAARTETMVISLWPPINPNQGQ